MPACRELRQAGIVISRNVRSVARCLKVVMFEECEHHRYAVRDLAVLEARDS